MFLLLLLFLFPLFFEDRTAPPPLFWAIHTHPPTQMPGTSILSCENLENVWGVVAFWGLKMNGFAKKKPQKLEYIIGINHPLKPSSQAKSI